MWTKCISYLIVCYLLLTPYAFGACFKDSSSKPFSKEDFQSEYPDDVARILKARNKNPNIQNYLNSCVQGDKYRKAMIDLEMSVAATAGQMNIVQNIGKQLNQKVLDLMDGVAKVRGVKQKELLDKVYKDCEISPSLPGCVEPEKAEQALQSSNLREQHLFMRLAMNNFITDGLFSGKRKNQDSDDLTYTTNVCEGGGGQSEELKAFCDRLKSINKTTFDQLMDKGRFAKANSNFKVNPHADCRNSVKGRRTLVPESQAKQMIPLTEREQGFLKNVWKRPFRGGDMDTRPPEVMNRQMDKLNPGTSDSWALGKLITQIMFAPEDGRNPNPVVWDTFNLTESSEVQKKLSKLFEAGCTADCNTCKGQCTISSQGGSSCTEDCKKVATATMGLFDANPDKRFFACQALNSLSVDTDPECEKSVSKNNLVNSHFRTLRDLFQRFGGNETLKGCKRSKWKDFVEFQSEVLQQTKKELTDAEFETAISARVLQSCAEDVRQILSNCGKTQCSSDVSSLSHGSEPSDFGGLADPVDLSTCTVRKELSRGMMGTASLFTCGNKKYIVKAALPEGKESLERERSLYSKLNAGSKHLPIVYRNTEDENGNPIIVMEYFEGKQLVSLVDPQESQDYTPLTMKEKFDLVIELLHGVDELQKKNVAHFDLHNQNVLISSDKKKIKIIDLGEAWDPARETLPIKATTWQSGADNFVPFGGSGPLQEEDPKNKFCTT